MIKEHYFLVIRSFFVVLAMTGCGPEPIPEPKDELGCIRPAGLVGLNPVDFQLAKTNIDKFAFGGLNVKTDPKVFEALRNTSRDSLSHEYLICRGEKQSLIKTFKQREYVRSKLQFMGTSPTSEQYLQWEHEHPVPE